MARGSIVDDKQGREPHIQPRLSWFGFACVFLAACFVSVCGNPMSLLERIGNGYCDPSECHDLIRYIYTNARWFA